jgi:calnexin
MLLPFALLAWFLGPRPTPRPLPLFPPPGTYFHFQSFDDEHWNRTWQVSLVPNVTGRWEVHPGPPPEAIQGEKMVWLSSEQAYYGLSTHFKEPLVLGDNTTLIVQYEHRVTDMIHCGGSYIKLFSDPAFSPLKVCNAT